MYLLMIESITFIYWNSWEDITFQVKVCMNGTISEPFFNVA